MLDLGLLYQDLIRTGQLAAEGRLPPVFPIVLYNGGWCCNAPVDVAELVVPMPGGLVMDCPRLKYFLLDEGRYADSELAPLRNLAAALLRMENSQTPRKMWNRSWRTWSPGCRPLYKDPCGGPSRFG